MKADFDLDALLLEPQPAAPATTDGRVLAAPSQPLPDSADAAPAREDEHEHIMLAIDLGRVRLDARQPRLCIPPDLRAEVCAGWISAAQAMETLFARAGGDDLAAQGYLSSIRDLAESVLRNRLLEPAALCQDEENGQIVYRLLWGWKEDDARRGIKTR